MRLVFVQEVVYFLKGRQKALQTGYYLFCVFFLQALLQKFEANKKSSDCEGEFLHRRIIA